MPLNEEFRCDAARWTPLLILSLAVALGGCAMPKLDFLHRDAPPATRTVWKSLDQYVRIEPQDADSGAVTPPNDHPVRLSPAQVRGMFASLRLSSGASADTVPVFSAIDLANLSEPVANALAQAGPGEDITFASIGMHPGRFTLERQLTTGRVFHHDGKLHVIFGTLHARFNDSEDRRLVPLLPGARTKPAQSDGRLAIQPGQALYRTGSAVRPDWVTLDITTAADTEPHAAPVPAVTSAPQTAGAIQRISIAQPPRPAADSATAPETRVLESGKSAEERLTILRRLRDKDLISEEEYQTKRRGILDEL